MMNKLKAADEYLKLYHLPYKDPSDRDSYSSYREGYSDAMDIAGQVIEQAQKDAYNQAIEELNREVWVDVIGYEGLYQASNMGRVKSLNYCRRGYAKILTPSTTGTCRDKRYKVTLFKDGIGEVYLVHRLVAKTFIPNPENKRTINHIEGNPANNNVNNLEWATSSENNLHAYRVLGKTNGNVGKRGAEVHNHRGVIQYSANGDFIRKWDSMSDAARYVGGHIENIYKCCRGIYNTSSGYRWRYTD